jgi:hypothetical protein
MLPTLPADGGSVVPSSGSSIDLLETVAFSTEPPAITVSGSLTETGEFLGRLEAPSLTALSAPVVRDITGLSYSPLRIFENGEPLAQPNASCRKVKKLGKGRYCHSHEVILLSTSDNTAPLSNSRSYTFALSDERQFKGGWWLYPGDTMLAQSQKLPGKANQRLVISAHPISASTTVSVQLRNADTVIMEQTFSANALGEGSLTLLLPKDVTTAVELEMRTTGHLVLKSAVLEWDE